MVEQGVKLKDPRVGSVTTALDLTWEMQWLSSSHKRCHHHVVAMHDWLLEVGLCYIR